MRGRLRQRDRPLSALAVAAGGAAGMVSTLLPWFSYSVPNGAGSTTSQLIGLHDVTGRAMLGVGLAELVFGLAYLRSRPGLRKRLLRVGMVLGAFFMITVPLAAMGHAASVPGSPAAASAVAGVQATGALGLIVGLLAAFVVLAGSWLTVLDSEGERVPRGRRWTSP